MTRRISGSLADLGPRALLRLLGAVGRSGVLELETAAGRLRLDIVQGRVSRPDEAELRRAGRVFSADSGAYRFRAGPVDLTGQETVTLNAYLGSATAAVDPQRSIESVVSGAASLDEAPSRGTAKIHVLPPAPPENPLDELLAELEATAPGELLLSPVGVVAADPRPWRGTLESDWLRRGWRLRLLGDPTSVPVEELDALVVHHRLSTTRVGHEDDWIRLLERTATVVPPVPVLWIGPLGDPVWVHRLVAAGAGFLLPPPQGDGGEALGRFIDSVTTVVDRLIGARHEARRSELSPGVSELVDALLHEADPEEAIGALLQLAAGQLGRGAVLTSEETSFRCRAGFGYPLARGSTALPRGVGLLERVVRSGQPELNPEPDTAGAVQLARVLGLEKLPAASVLIPLGRGPSASGLLVADCGGDPLPDLAELVVLAGRFGGLVVGRQ